MQIDSCCFNLLTSFGSILCVLNTQEVSLLDPWLLTPLNNFTIGASRTAQRLGDDFLAVGFSDSSTVLYDLSEPFEKQTALKSVGCTTAVACIEIVNGLVCVAY